MARAAADALALDRVLLVVAGDPWRKRDRAVTGAAHRLAMVRAAVEAAGDPRLAVSDAEVRRDGPTHTVDTLRELQAPQRALWFILGADALEDLPRWHTPRELVRLARLAVAPRPGVAPDLDALERAVPGLRDAVDLIPMTPIDLSATELRARVRTDDAVDPRVPAGAREYIERHGLYRG